MLLLAIKVSIVAFVYSGILTEPNNLLNKPYNWADRFLPWWLAKPLITCEICVTGQFALWFYVFNFPILSDLSALPLFISYAILTTKIFQKWIK